MKIQDIYAIFKIDDLRDLPDKVRSILSGNIFERNNIYLSLLALNNYDLSYDWFQGVFEDELAQRKQSKQDFTPNSVGKLAALLTGNKGRIYEPTAGNGSMVISAWWQRCLESDFPLMHFPSDHMIECWELSARSIPILLLNLSIRGMMGVVYHGDVLEQTVKCKYILLNRTNDTLGFSEIITDESNNKIIIEI